MPGKKKIQLAADFFAPTQIQGTTPAENAQSAAHQRSMAIILGVADGKRRKTSPALEKAPRSPEKRPEPQPSLACAVDRMIDIAGKNVASAVMLMWRLSTLPLRLGSRLFS